MPLLEGYARAALELAAPPRGSRVVDVACGPGTLAILAAHSGLTVDALDFSPVMVAKLAARAELLTATVTACVGDGMALPYEAGTFAAGFSMFGLFMFRDRAAGFAELRRVLARGARAVVASWVPAARTPLFAAIFGGMADAMAAAGLPARTAPFAQMLSTADECRAEMGGAFGEVAVHEVVQAKWFPSVDAAWESCVRTIAPIALMHAQLAPDQWLRFDGALRTALARELGAGPVELALPALLTVGTAA